MNPREFPNQSLHTLRRIRLVVALILALPIGYGGFRAAPAIHARRREYLQFEARTNVLGKTPQHVIALLGKINRDAKTGIFVDAIED